MVALYNRLIRFFGIHLRKNTLFLFWYAINYFNPRYIPKVRYLTYRDLVEQIRDGKSLIRIGDGEVYIMNFGSIGYQPFDEELRQALFSIIKNYSSDSRYLIGLNRIPISKSNQQLKLDKLFYCWQPMKVYWQLFFPKQLPYFDATLFYYNHVIPEYFEPILLERQIVLVSSVKNIQAIKNNPNIPFQPVAYVETPENNAWGDYERIEREVVQSVRALNNQNNVIVLAAFGPATKVFAHRLSALGIQVIDVGRGIEIAYTDERIDHIIYPDLTS